MLLNLLVVALIVTILLTTSTIPRIVLGLPLVLFFPGYVFILALFPRKEGMSGIERVALSFGLSIAVVPLIGLVLNYTPWGIRLYPILVSLLFFIVVMSGIGWYRQWKLLPGERFMLRFECKLPSVSHLWASQTPRGKILTIVLVVIILSASGALSYVINTPKMEDGFTEFYVLNTEGKAENYPRAIILGQSAKVILGIVNHEHETTVYKIEIAIDGKRAGEIGPTNLNAEEKWEQVVTFTPTRVGPNQKMEFLLYTGVSTDVYERVHLWIEVE